MAIYLTSDQHFGHGNIIRYSGRPFRDLDEMHSELIRRHNSVVCADDTVYHLGDFSLDERMVPRFLPLLAGKHILITGNHDACHPRRPKWRKHAAGYLNHGFAEVHAVGWMTLPGHPGVMLAHMPSTDAADARYPEWRPKGGYQTLLHGHVHERWKQNGRMINVGVDQWDYAPVALETLLRLV